ncbi:MAG: hypothetical protein AMXMBFR33_25720 [Candidatus Xenobia bacterium]
MLALLAPLAAVWTLGPGPAEAPDLRQTILLGRSLAVAGLACLLALVLGTGLAVLLSHRNLPLRGLALPVLAVPFLLPPYLLAVALPWPPTWWAAGVVLGLHTMPLVLYPALLALTRIDASLAEAALLARGPARAWGRVLLPMVAPVLGGGTALAFLFGLADYGVPSLLQVDTYPVEVFALLDGYHDFGAAARASLPLWLLGAAVALITWRLTAPRLRELFSARAVAPARFRLEPRLRWPAALLLVAAMAAVLTPPLALVSRANRVSLIALGLWEASGDLLNTLGFSLAAALTAVGLAGWLACRPDRWVHLGALLLLASPPALLALGIVRLYGPELIGGLTGRYLAVPLLLLGLSFSLVPRTLHDAVRLAGRGRRLLYVDLHRPVYRLGFCLVFALAAGDLTLSLLLTPPGGGSLSMRIFNMAHYGRPDLVAALSLILMAVSLSPLVASLCLGVLEERA